jgi:hypothetical protein
MLNLAKWGLVCWLVGSCYVTGAPTLRADLLRHSAASDSAVEEFSIEANHDRRVLIKLVSRLAQCAERNAASLY